VRSDCTAPLTKNWLCQFLTTPLALALSIAKGGVQGLHDITGLSTQSTGRFIYNAAALKSPPLASPISPLIKGGVFSIVNFLRGLSCILLLPTLLFAAPSISIFYPSDKPACIGAPTETCDLFVKEGLQGAKLAIKTLAEKDPKHAVAFHFYTLDNMKTSALSDYNLLLGGREDLNHMVLSKKAMLLSLHTHFNKRPLHFYNAAFDNTAQAYVASHYITAQLHRTRVIIIRPPNDDEARTLTQLFRKDFQQEKGLLLGTYLSTDPTLIQTIEHSNADILYIAGSAEETLPVTLKIRKAGIQTPIMGSEALRFFILEKNMLLDNIFFPMVNTYDPTFIEPPLEAFRQAYKNTYKSYPETIEAAMAYDAIMALNAATLSGKPLDTFSDFQGALGTYDFNSPTPLSRIAIIKLVKGKTVLSGLLNTHE
jgi:hypothetical protein